MKLRHGKLLSNFALHLNLCPSRKDANEKAAEAKAIADDAQADLDMAGGCVCTRDNTTCVHD